MTETAQTSNKSKEAALLAAKVADQKKATDIVIQEVGQLLNLTDYFVICTGANNRRVDAIAEEIEEHLLKDLGIKPISSEGRDEAKWILLDYGNIVVHIFQPEAREFYRLEQLWEQAPTVDVALAGIEDPTYSERIESLLNRR